MSVANNRISSKGDAATTPTANGGPKHTELRNNAINEAAETSMKQARALRLSAGFIKRHLMAASLLKALFGN
ncbi:hypothetical protein HPB47_003689 [Ixodes persulcatus]|uniref:Uncharacterized protein n=1 Tax=Ixodes persulcatus TaxID=34615 RepID=A0AC60PIS9_IXOPE|nr:hypothetical protein HPB47_003689 [Ixodes persulcatus]